MDNRDHDTFVDKMLKETQFVVEATSCESHDLWKTWSVEGREFCRPGLKHQHPRYNSYSWEQISRGSGQQVGEVTILEEKKKYPVCISLFWWRINGVLVMFYEATSMVTHHGMIEKWLKENCSPKWDNGTRVAHTDAMNFHHVLDHIDEVTKPLTVPSVTVQHGGSYTRKARPGEPPGSTIIIDAPRTKRNA